MPAEGTDMAETPALIFIGGDAPHPR
ncbi:MAG: hypothetical protein RLZ18_21, partial [Actinomycetota bacterium]